MKKINWNVVEEKDYGAQVETPPAGGYVVKIVDIKDVPDRNYLLINYDIAEGEWEDWWMAMYETQNWGLPRHYASYSDKAQGMFKHFLICLEKSNPNFRMTAWDNDEHKLVGLKFGAVIGEEEYEGKDGKVKKAKRIQRILSIEDIRKGNFKVPELKKLKPKETTTPIPAAPSYYDAGDASCPF